MRLSNDKTLSLRIASLQGLYWMIFCPIYSFASIYLLSKGFTNQKIGWVLAVNSILAVLLQPVIGSAADRFKKIPLKVFLSFWKYDDWRNKWKSFSSFFLKVRKIDKTWELIIFFIKNTLRFLQIKFLLKYVKIALKTIILFPRMLKSCDEVKKFSFDF